MLHPHRPGNAALARDAKLRTRAARASVTVASALVAAKLGAALITGSVSILASLVDSLADLAASALTLFSVRKAQRPPDADHRFGHGKAEALSSLVQATLIAGSAVFVVTEAWRSLSHPEPVVSTGLGLGVMVLSLVLTGALVLYQRHVVRETGSIAISGDLAHYVTDFLSAFAVMAALAVEHWTNTPWIDPVMGALVAIYLAATAWGVARRAVDELMDRELPDSDRSRIEDLVRSVPKVQGLHDLRTRAAGASMFIELHLELDPQMRLGEAHHVADEVIARVRSVYPSSDVLVHQDPADVDEHRLDDVVAHTENQSRAGVPDPAN
ncbi:cation diffusion facilitator family transporter [Engelhardtia mirabilis]|uniref:cation diffusion facilitator family transporter n=1 Tax=Engelhardtia mirabilis TaxID=2528011 RepID=UPI003AF406BF